MVDSSPSPQWRRPYKTNKGTSDEAADAAALTYLLTWFVCPLCCLALAGWAAVLGIGQLRWLRVLCWCRACRLGWECYAGT